MNPKKLLIIELHVNNHPGVMSHITGLFSRRGYNMEGILCGAIGEGETSLIYLLIAEDEKLEQIILQLSKLYDVLNVKLRPDYDHKVFFDIDKLLTQQPG
ncbi:ACT domain-containing protein [Marinilabilia sp.]|uniref:ACT domain-containing protein n=1 Tax=Marinilabilia sp. TaxID=2021252 RepID=UPI0025B7B13A|nr:ACT domain-containing protein [Marinilabilia sp.]